MVAYVLRWVTLSLIVLGERPSSAPTLFADNKAMIPLSREPRLEGRIKHIEICRALSRCLVSPPACCSGCPCAACTLPARYPLCSHVARALPAFPARRSPTARAARTLPASRPRCLLDVGPPPAAMGAALLALPAHALPEPPAHCLAPPARAPALSRPRIALCGPLTPLLHCCTASSRPALPCLQAYCCCLHHQLALPLLVLPPSSPVKPLVSSCHAELPKPSYTTEPPLTTTTAPTIAAAATTVLLL
ncbi:unnamed protein product [Closterium sp. NIES-54]